MSGLGMRICCCTSTLFNLVRLNASGSPPGTEWKSLIGSGYAGRIFVPGAPTVTTAYMTVSGDSGDYFEVGSDGVVDNQVTWSGTQSVIRDVSTGGNTYGFTSGPNIVKYNTDGTEAWSTAISSSMTTVLACAVDGSGNVIVVGADGTVGLEYFNSSGTSQWTANPIQDGSGNSDLGAVHFDSSGNVYAFGTIDSNGDFLVKLNSSGTEQWKYPTDTSTYSGSGITMGVQYVSGNTYLIVHSSLNRIEKVDSSGSQSYANTLSDAQPLTISGLGPCPYEVDSSDNWYIVVGNNSDVTDNKVKKYNSSGTLQWTETDLPDRSAAAGMPVAIDSNDQLWVSGDETTA